MSERPTIEDFSRLVPDSLRTRSGAVFYSGRAAFGAPSSLYLLGLNPGGSLERLAENTVERHIDKVLKQVGDRWSAFCDERWGPSEGEPGTIGMQPRVIHLLRRLGFDPRLVPASNLIFLRTPDEGGLGSQFHRLAEDCWTFHERVIAALEVKVVLCFGRKAGEWVSARLGAYGAEMRFEEDNDRRWATTARANRAGQVVVIATHPARANWQNPKSDPTNFVRQFLPGTS